MQIAGTLIFVISGAVFPLAHHHTVSKPSGNTANAVGRTGETGCKEEQAKP